MIADVPKRPFTRLADRSTCVDPWSALGRKLPFPRRAIPNLSRRTTTALWVTFAAFRIGLLGTAQLVPQVLPRLACIAFAHPRVDVINLPLR